VKGDMPPENRSRLISGSVAARVRSVRQGGVCAARRSAGHCDQFDLWMGIAARSTLKAVDGCGR
jgi:hypothetical protein